MKNLTQEYLKSSVSGFLLAIVLITLSAPAFPTNAQIAVAEINSTGILTSSATTSATQKVSLAKQISEYAATAARWSERVRMYTNEIFQMARQFTSLKGVLGIAMQTAGLSTDDLKGIKEWATAVYAVMNVKRQFESLWESRMTLFRAWYSRSKNGIFNPQQDWLELQRYFLDSIGRRSYEYELEMEKMRQLDHEFERWRQELEKLRNQEAELALQKRNIDQQLADEQTLLASLRPVTVNDQSGTGQIDTTLNRQSISQQKIIMLTTQQARVEDSLRDVQAKIQELIDKMNNRYQYYYLVYGKAIEGGNEVFSNLEGWESVGGLRIGELNRLIDQNPNAGQNLPQNTPTP